MPTEGQNPYLDFLINPSPSVLGNLLTGKGVKQ